MNTDIIGAQFKFGAEDNGVLALLAKVEAKIDAIQKKSQGIFSPTPQTTTKGATQNNRNAANNTVPYADVFNKTINGLGLIEKYQLKLSDLHIKEMQLRNEINSDFKIIARETGKIMRQMQSYNAIGGVNKGGINPMEATRQISANNAFNIETEKNRKAEELHQSKLANIKEDERRKDDKHKEKLRRDDELHAKRMSKLDAVRASKARLHNGFINEASFGGIYLTGLIANYATAPYRNFRDYENELVVAAKNANREDINTIQDVRRYGQNYVLSAYDNQNSMAMKFGILPSDIAKARGELIQMGFTDKTQAENQLLNKVMDQVFKMENVFEVSHENALKFAAYTPEFAKKEFAAFQRNLGIDPTKTIINEKGQKVTIDNKEGLDQFLTYVTAMVGKLTKENPYQAKEMIDAVVRFGPTMGLGDIPMYAALDFLGRGLEMGISPQVIATSGTRLFSDFTNAMTKKGIWHDPKKEKMMQDIRSGKADFLGLKGEYGAYAFTIDELINSIHTGKISMEEADQILRVMAQGKLGRNQAIVASVSRGYMRDKEGKLLSNEDFRNRMSAIQQFNLGAIDPKNIPEALKDIVVEANKEVALVLGTLQKYEDRMKLAGKLFSVASMKTFLPLTTGTMGGLTKLLTGYTDLESAPKDTAGQVVKMGGLIGAMNNSPALQTALQILGVTILTGIALQIAKIAGKGIGGVFGNVGILGGRLGQSALFGGLVKRLTPAQRRRISLSTMAEDAILARDFKLLNAEERAEFLRAQQRQIRREELLSSLSPMGRARRAAFGKLSPNAQRYISGAGTMALAGGTALALNYGGDIMGMIDSIFSSGADGVAKFSSTDFGKGLGGGWSAITDLTDMKNMVAYYLLTSGNKTMATGAAIYLGNKFFNGFYDKIGGNEGKTQAEIDKESAYRSAALTVLMYAHMLGPAGIYVALGAAAYLGYDFASHWFAKQGAVGSANETIEKRNKQIIEKYKASGIMNEKGEIIPEKMTEYFKAQGLENEASHMLKNASAIGEGIANELGVKKGTWQHNVTSRVLAGAFLDDEKYNFKRNEADRMLSEQLAEKRKMEEQNSPQQAVNINIMPVKNADGTTDLQFEIGKNKKSFSDIFGPKQPSNFNIQMTPSMPSP